MPRKTRSASGFTSVTLAGIGNVYLTQGATEAVRIEAEDNLIPYFETVRRRYNLEDRHKSQYMGVNLQPTQPVKFYVTLPKIEAVTLAGSGNIFGGTLKTSAFKIALLGSGNISTDTLTATTVDINLSGSGNISLGSSRPARSPQTITGSGDIQVDSLTADKVTSKTAGSGNITARRQGQRTVRRNPGLRRLPGQRLEKRHRHRTGHRFRQQPGVRQRDPERDHPRQRRRGLFRNAKSERQHLRLRQSPPGQPIMAFTRKISGFKKSPSSFEN